MISYKLLSVRWLLILLMGAASCDSGPGGNEEIVINVRISAPSAGSMLEAATTVEVQAVPAEEIIHVVVLVDNDTLAVDQSAPFSALWNVGFWADGQEHELVAIAQTRSGETVRSASVRVIVSERAQIIPMPVTPLNGEEFPSTPGIPSTEIVTLAWHPLQDISTYEVEIAADHLFSDVSQRLMPSDTMVQITPEMGYQYWRVRGYHATHRVTAWSPPLQFWAGWTGRRSSSESPSIGADVVATPDGGALAYGSTNKPTGERQVILLRVGPTGEVLWEKTWAMGRAPMNVRLSPPLTEDSSQLPRGSPPKETTFFSWYAWMLTVMNGGVLSMRPRRV